MNRHALHALCLAAAATLAACGDAPLPPDGGLAPRPRLQPVPFSGVADPVRGTARVDAGPRALVGKVPEDVNGDPLTATPGTAQVYGVNAAWPSAPPAACGNAVAGYGYMAIQVQVLSGFATQQLRNVYARIGSVTPGHTFCAPTTPSTSFAGSAALTPNQGLFLYAPLDGGLAAGSATSRTVEWDMILPDNGPFSFSGDLWAEIIPLPPAITTAPAHAAATNTITGTGKNNLDVTFTWAPDSLATGTDPEAFGVSRPATGSWTWTLSRCNSNTLGFDPLACTTTATQTLIGPASVATPVTTTRTFRFGGKANDDETVWWRATLDHVYLLPGEATSRITTTSLVFRLVP